MQMVPYLFMYNNTNYRKFLYFISIIILVNGVHVSSYLTTNTDKSI